MKKLVMSLAFFLLAGCSEGASNSSETPSSIEVSSAAASERSSSSAASEVSSRTSEESASSAESTNGETNALTLYIPKSLNEDEGTPLYDEVIKVAEEFIQNNANTGEPGLFTLSYTGHYIQNDDGSLQAYFMGLNRVSKPLRNLTFTLHFVVDGTPVWDNMPITLDEDEFGQQPVHTAMPIFLDVPAGKEELLINSVPKETEVGIFDLDAE